MWNPKEDTDLVPLEKKLHKKERPWGKEKSNFLLGGNKGAGPMDGTGQRKTENQIIHG